MTPATRQALIGTWLQAKNRWISSTDLHCWMRTTLHTSAHQRHQDVRALLDAGVMTRRPAPRRGRYYYRWVEAPAAPQGRSKPSKPPKPTRRAAPLRYPEDIASGTFDFVECIPCGVTP